MEAYGMSGARVHNGRANPATVVWPARRSSNERARGLALPLTGFVGLSLLLLALGLVPAALGSGLTGAVAPLQITSFVAGPSTFVISNPTWLNVTAVGGVAPYTYNYTGLPIGCASANTSSLYCVARAVETDTVTVNVSDPAGDHAAATVHFTVTNGYKGPPVIQSIVITPNPGAVGQVSTIQVNAVSVSNSTLTFFYFDLPPGCASFNQTPLQCLPSAPGSFSIGVQVTDAFGQPVITHVAMTVTGTANPGPTGSKAPLPAYVLYGVPVVVIVLALVVGVVLFRRPRRPQGEIPSFAPPPQS
jgi:hypothetical protein